MLLPSSNAPGSFGGTLADNEAAFEVLEGPMIVVAVIVLSVSERCGLGLGCLRQRGTGLWRPLTLMLGEDTQAPQREMKSSVTMEDVSPSLIRLGILSALFGQPIETC
jgi:hypothetical protein